jgi:hypothetical protein
MTRSSRQSRLHECHSAHEPLRGYEAEAARCYRDFYMHIMNILTYLHDPTIAGDIEPTIDAAVAIICFAAIG